MPIDQRLLHDTSCRCSGHRVDGEGCCRTLRFLMVTAHLHKLDSFWGLGLTHLGYLSSFMAFSATLSLVVTAVWSVYHSENMAFHVKVGLQLALSYRTGWFWSPPSLTPVVRWLVGRPYLSHERDRMLFLDPSWPRTTTFAGSSRLLDNTLACPATLL